MSEFKSGLTYEQLKAIADAGAIDKLSKGSIRKNGKKWQAQLSDRIPDPTSIANGDNKPKSRRVFLTRQLTDTQVSGRDYTRKSGANGTDALFAEWRAQVIADARQVAGFNVDPTQPTRVCIERFIEKSETRQHQPIRSSTATNYRFSLKRISKFPLANQPLISLTTPQIQGMLDCLDRKDEDSRGGTGLARKTIKQTFDLLNLVMKDALGESAPNPCKGVRVPDGKPSTRIKGGQPNILTRTGIAKFNSVLDRLEGDPNATQEQLTMALAARIALGTGLRSEELCALTWGDVDINDDGRVRIFISHVIERSETPARDDDGNFVRDKDGNVVTNYTERDTRDVYAHDERRTKSVHSKRNFIALAEIGAMIAKKFYETQEALNELFLDSSEAPAIADLYVLGDLNGNFLSPRKLCKRWLSFSEQNGLIGSNGIAVSMHDMRHTFASQMASAGMKDKILQRLMGQADIKTTLQYYIAIEDEAMVRGVDAAASVFNARADDKDVIPFTRSDRMQSRNEAI